MSGRCPRGVELFNLFLLFFSSVSLHFSADRLTSLNTKKADLLFVAASSPEVVASLLPGLFGYTYSDLKVLFLTIKSRLKSMNHFFFWPSLGCLYKPVPDLLKLFQAAGLWISL